ncbi:thymidine phosphorylase [Candidatus Pacearchaeota archaeon]|nr:thymidine phosphorylase [Candidatus Pacearchaeota archaeon]
MELKIRLLKWGAGKPIALLNNELADRLNIHVRDRVIIKRKEKNIIAVVDISHGFLKKDEIGATKEVWEHLKCKAGDLVDIMIAPKPESVLAISKKLRCEPLDNKEIYGIIKDIVSNALTEAEIAFFVSGVYKCGMSIDEIVYMIKALVETGETLELKNSMVADKHGIGGIPGNRTTPIVIPICASAGLIMPKTSSRAITSAAGTADVIETICRIDFNIEEIKRIIDKTNACMVWGGALGLAPGDDRIIQIERLLNLDPEPQLLASIMSKKISVGSRYVLIDIPYGPTAKVPENRAFGLREKFKILGKRFGMIIETFLSKATGPIGNGIGPILEMRDVLSVLDNNGPEDLEDKSLKLAGKLLEMTKKAKKGNGIEVARSILRSGQAYDKFEEIINAQKGRIKKLHEGRFSYDVMAQKDCKLVEIDNKKLNTLARIAGSPIDKGAGIYLWKNKGDKIRKDASILTLYSESRHKLNDAIRFLKILNPTKVC